MAIQIFTDRTLAAHDQEKTNRITELEGQVTRLTEQSTKLSEEKQEVERLLAECYEKIADLASRLDKAEQEATERFETNTELRKELGKRDERIIEIEYDEAILKERLDTANAVIRAQSEVIETQKKELADNLQARSVLPDDVLAFFRSLHKGDFRSDRMGPVAFNAAQSLLWKYDSKDEKQVLSE